MKPPKIDSCSPYHQWEQQRGRITSATGKWEAGKHVHTHGYNIMDELVGKISYMQMMILNVTGRLVEDRLAYWIENTFTCLSWPDPRIWCNHIGALAGTMKTSVVASAAAGCLGADSFMYGASRSSVKGIQFIQQALIDYKAGLSVEELVEKHKKPNGRPVMMGFARPVHGKDERIAPMDSLRSELEYGIEEHLSLALKIGDFLEKNYGEGINIGGYSYAFLADHGFTGEEIYRIRALVVASGVVACYIEESEKTAESFLPLHCEDINYQGIAPRELPSS